MTFHSTTGAFYRDLSSFLDDQLKEYGLPVSYIEVIRILNEKEKATQKDISEELALAPSTITRFVRKLIDRGWVQKTREGREAYVSLTEKGERHFKFVERDYQHAMDALDRLLGGKFRETVGGLAAYGSQQLQPPKEGRD
ncbi:MAG: MarR family winged helix-turn-helix transcriptional regulator [Balneolaceae bacterium]